MNKRTILDKFEDGVSIRVEIYQHLVGYPNTYFMYRRTVHGHVVCVYTNKKYAALVRQIKLRYGEI